MKKIVCAIVAFSALFVCCYGQTIDLKFNLPKGADYNYNMNMDISVKGNAGGQEVDVTNNMGMGYVFKVLDDSSGWKKMSSTIARIAMNMNAGGMNINFDTDKPADTSNVVNDMIGKVLGSMKGGQFTFIMNSKGEIGYITGIDELIQRMTSAVPEAGDMASGMGSAFDGENFKKNMQQVFGAYPGKSVKAGDTWTNSYSTTNGGIEMNMDNTYTLESVSGNNANVKVDSKISSATATAPMSGSMTGLLKYDIPSGVPVDGNLDMDLKMSQESAPMNIGIKMKISGQKS